MRQIGRSIGGELVRPEGPLAGHCWNLPCEIAAEEFWSAGGRRARSCQCSILIMALPLELPMKQSLHLPHPQPPRPSVRAMVLPAHAERTFTDVCPLGLAKTRMSLTSVNLPASDPIVRHKSGAPNSCLYLLVNSSYKYWRLLPTDKNCSERISGDHNDHSYC